STHYDRGRTWLASWLASTPKHGASPGGTIHGVVGGAVPRELAIAPRAVGAVIHSEIEPNSLALSGRKAQSRERNGSLDGVSTSTHIRDHDHLDVRLLLSAHQVPVRL